MLLGQQSGNAKYTCFLCLWDSQDGGNHYKKKVWSKRMLLERGSGNVINDLVVETSTVLLPPLRIKLGLMKQFEKALDKEGQCFNYIMSQIPQLSDAKLKDGIFNSH